MHIYTSIHAQPHLLPQPINIIYMHVQIHNYTYYIYIYI